MAIKCFRTLLDTVIGKQSQYKKTEPRLRLFLPSKLPIRGLKFIEKQIFYPCPFFLLANLWFSYAKLEAKWCVKREISSFKLPVFDKKCYYSLLKISKVTKDVTNTSLFNLIQNCWQTLSYRAKNVLFSSFSIQSL